MKNSFQLCATMLASSAVLACASSETGLSTNRSPVALAFAAEPELIERGTLFASAITVVVEDSVGEIVRAPSFEVSLHLQGPSGADQLQGILTVLTVDGVATFNDLRVASAGAGNNLTASAFGLEGATSIPFDVVVPFLQIDAGGFHTCGVTVDSTVLCWGYNYFGELGDGTDTNRSSPHPVTGQLAFGSVSTGYFTCGLSLSGHAYCWGNAFPPTPTIVSQGLAFSSVATGNLHACALTGDGQAYCWGDNLYGSLGDGTTLDRTGPVAVIGGLSFESLSVGAWHTCAISVGREAYCWGVNTWGALGDSSQIDRLSPVKVAGGLLFSPISAGQTHSCGIAADGDTYCWGNNGHGQLGSGTTLDSPSPVRVHSADRFVSVTSGGDQSCALTASGTAFCWGFNPFGNLGDGTLVDRSTPVQVQSNVRFVAISAGINQHTCAIRAAGAAYCWGNGSDGQLGRGMPDYRDTPTSVLAQ